MIALLVCACAVVLDYAYARCVSAHERGDGHRAGLWSMAMYLIGLPGLFGVLQISWWLVVPELVGLYIGSRLAHLRREIADPTRVRADR